MEGSLTTNINILSSPTHVVVKAMDVRRMGIPKRKLFGTIIASSRCLAGRLCGIPIKVLLYDDLVGIRHLSSRDKDGGHTIRSAIVENPLHSNFTALSSIGRVSK